MFFVEKHRRLSVHEIFFRADEKNFREEGGNLLFTAWSPGSLASFVQDDNDGFVFRDPSTRTAAPCSLRMTEGALFYRAPASG